MRKEVTQKQKDQWQKSREKGVKKYQARIKSESLVPKEKSPVLKSVPKKKAYVISKKGVTQKKRDKLYFKAKQKFFEDPENAMCKMRISPECIEFHMPADDLHHMKGKCGNLYWDSRYFMATCRYCHNYELNHDAEAKEKGVSLLRLTK